MRDVSGTKSMGALAFTKIEKVGVAPAGKFTWIDWAGGCRHCAFAGLDWHTCAVKGRVAPPVSADTTIGAAIPTLLVATAKALPWFWLSGTVTMPSCDRVAECAMMSGTGIAEKSRSMVLTPGVFGAWVAPPH